MPNRDEDPHRRSGPLLAPFPAFALLSKRPLIRASANNTSGNSGRSSVMSKRLIAAFAALAVTAGGAVAQEVKVGVVLPYTGIGAELAQQIERGMDLYLKLNADQVKPYTIKFIKRDSKAPNGAEAKVAVQELLTQDKVDAIARLCLFARRHRLGADRRRRQQARGDHECRHRFHHQSCAGIRAHVVHHVAFRLRHGRGGGQDAARENRGRRLYRLPAWQGQPGGVQDRVRGEWRQGDRRHPGGRARRRSRFHAVLPARQGREARRALRVRAVRRSRHGGGARPTARSACAPPASS